MELKSYQQEVINDLDAFLKQLSVDNNLSTAYQNFWSKKGINVNDLKSDILHPYDNTVKGVPRAMFKVPTAGGKTFIACNALKTIFDNQPANLPRVVAWFVPSDSILSQTYKNLNNPQHPYRQRINTLFNNAVQVVDKETALSGQGIKPSQITEQLTIFVLSVQSFAANNKDGRRVYRENSSLAGYADFNNSNDKIDGADETSLIQAIAHLNPVVIIDESHNFEADLRLDMLGNINPRFILDLTATPRRKSNIISFVDAMKLKRANMVKLPVILVNRDSTNEVLIDAIQLQRNLEKRAIDNEQNGGAYIRPIVLLQAQPKSDKDNVTFDKIKQSLVESGIPEEQIKIKTANINELKGIDLMSETCPVRYIITINALKEGWDCPFAYILASLANKTSSIDVEQILGRILRQPYTHQHKSVLLNQSYVYSCSANFQETLDSIVRGLNGAGFSDKDYRVATEQQNVQTLKPTIGELPFGSPTPKPIKPTKPEPTNVDDIDTDVVSQSMDTDDTDTQEQVRQAEEAAKKATAAAKEEEENNPTGEPEEIKDKQMENTATIVEKYSALVKNLKLPQFFIEDTDTGLFSTEDKFRKLERSDLYDGFNLAVQDKNLDLLNIINNNIVAFDVTDDSDYVLKKIDVNQTQKQILHETYVMYGKDAKIMNFANALARDIRIDEISQKQVECYIKDLLVNGNFTDEQLMNFIDNPTNITLAVKNKIRNLLAAYANEQFFNKLTTSKIRLQPSFSFQEKLIFDKKDNSLQKTLYSAEKADMNRFELSVATIVSTLPNVRFWHRNLDRGMGFCINGFINHYPDFVIYTEHENIILLETKGEQLSNDDSKDKLTLGTKWADKAGDKFHYFMVFENNGIDGAKTLIDFIGLLKDM